MVWGKHTFNLGRVGGDSIWKENGLGGKRSGRIGNSFHILYIVHKAL